MNEEQAHEGLEVEEKRLRSIRDTLEDSSEDSGDSTDANGADAGVEQTQKEVDLSILEQVESELKDVERAMRKLEQGQYGICEVCNEQIPDERLAAQPATRFCTAHAEAASSQG